MSFVTASSGRHCLEACLLVASLLGACSPSGGVGSVTAETTSADGITVSAPAERAHSAIHVTTLAAEQLRLPVPPPFKLLRAFHLEMGPGELADPVQITLAKTPVADSHAVVLFLRQTSLPNKAGVEVPLWMQEARGVVSQYDQVRTDSSERSGLRFGGDYAVVVADASLVSTVQGQVSYFFPVDRSGTFAVVAAPDQPAPLAGWLGSHGEFQMVVGLGPVTLKAIQVTSQGYVAEASMSATVTPSDRGVQQGRRAEVSIQLIPIADGLSSRSAAWGAPEIKKGNLQKVEDGFELTFEGERFVFANERAPREKREGAEPTDVKVHFRMPGRKAPFVVSPRSGSTAGQLRVPVPAGVILGLTQVSIVRPQWLRTRSGWDRHIEVASKEEPLEGDPHYYLVPSGEAHVAVHDIKTHALVKRIPFGDGASPARPRFISMPNEDNRAYVTLRQGAGVAVVDTELLQAVDLIPETPRIDHLPFESGQPAGMVWCCLGRQHERLYVSDGEHGRIAVYDVTVESETFHQRLKWITVESAPKGLRDLAIDGMRNRLYVIAPDGVMQKQGPPQSGIAVIDVDPDHDTYGRELARIPVEGTPVALDAHGYASSPVVFVSQKSDGPYLGVIRDAVMTSSAQVSYLRIGPLLSADPSAQLTATGVKVIRAGQMSKWQTVPYVAVSYVATRPGSDVDSLGAGGNPNDVQGGIGMMADPAGPNSQFTELTSLTRGTVPFLSRDQYGELYVLDRQQGAITKVNLEQVFVSLADPTAYRPSLTPDQGSSKIFQGSFKAEASPYDIAPAGALKVQLWVQ